MSLSSPLLPFVHLHFNDVQQGIRVRCKHFAGLELEGPANSEASEEWAEELEAMEAIYACDARLVGIILFLPPFLPPFAPYTQKNSPYP